MIVTKQPTELWHSNKDSRLLKGEVFQKNDEDVIIKGLYSLVSLGTERLVITQNLNQSLADKMTVPYMKGNLAADFTYGYSLVGQVIEGSDDVNGAFVHLMHPHQDIVSVKRDDLTIIPQGLDPKLATLASNMETAVNAIWDAELEVGDEVLVIGYGIIGALISLLAKNIAGVSVTILENNPNKNLAISDGGFKKHERGVAAKYDVVFNTSSSEEMLQKAIIETRSEGKIVEVSWYGDRSINVNLGAHFHYGRKRIICSQVSHIPHRKQPLWTYEKRKKLVFKLLADLNPIHLIDSEVTFNDSPAFFNKLRKEPMDSIGVVIKY